MNVQSLIRTALTTVVVVAAALPPVQARIEYSSKLNRAITMGMLACL